MSPTAADAVPAAFGRADRIVLGSLLLAGAVAWGWLGVAVHTLPVIGGECDCYVDRAADILRGDMRADGFHPLGLPLLIAGVARLGIDVFMAGRLVAIAGGLLLLACTYVLARRFASRPAAAMAAVAVGASQDVLLGAVQACTDVPSAGLVALALLCWTRAAADGARAPLLLGGLALGLAASLRTPAIVFALALLPLLVGASWRERLRRGAAAALGGVLGLAPHLLTVWLTHGSLLQNSHQVVWKYRYRQDTAALTEYLQHPEPVRWSELPGWCRQGLADLLGYLGQGLGAPWSGPWSGGGAMAGALAIGVSLLMTAAMTLPLVRARRAACVLAIGAWAYALELCLLSIPLARLTVPMAMPAVLLLILASTRLPFRLPRSLPSWTAAALAALALLAVPRALDDFDRLHPRDDLQAIRQLIAEHGEWITVATPAIGLDRQADCFFVVFRPPEDPAAPPELHWRQVLGDARARAADFVVVGQRTWPLPYRALSGAPPPPGYAVRRHDAVLVLARTDLQPWCRDATATLLGDDLELRVQTAPDLDAQTLAGVGFMVRDDEGQWQRLLLPPLGDGSFARTITGGGRLARRGTFVPAMLTRDGVLRGSRPVELRSAGAAPGRR